MPMLMVLYWQCMFPTIPTVWSPPQDVERGSAVARSTLVVLILHTGLLVRGTRRDRYGLLVRGTIVLAGAIVSLV